LGKQLSELFFSLGMKAVLPGGLLLCHIIVMKVSAVKVGAVSAA
jgi:hypothetical protein